MHNKYLKLVYAFAFFSIVSVFLISYYLIHNAVLRKEKDAKTINMAGRQRTLSQRITQQCLRYAALEKGNSMYLKNQLESDVRLWNDLHQKLSNINKNPHSDYAENTPEIDSLYQNIQPSFLAIIRLSNAITTDDDSVFANSATNKLLLDSIIEQQALFLPQMETIVNRYEELSQQKLLEINTIGFRCFCAGFLLLMVEAFFVFIPILRHNNILYKELTHQNKQLQNQNLALQQNMAKEAEQKIKLAESESMFRFIAENTTDGIIVFENGAFPYTSPAYQKILGYDKSVTEKRDLASAFNLVHPDDYERIRTTILTALAEKQPSMHYEFQVMHNDGYYVWREDSVTNIYDEEGNHTKSIIIARNITKKKEYERTRIEREQLLTSIFDTVNDTIFVLEVEEKNEFRFSLVNKMFFEITGIKISEVIGSKLQDILPQPALENTIIKLNEAINQHKIVRWQETSEYPIGLVITELSVTPIYDAEGNCVRLIGSMHDITEQVNAEKAMFQSHQRLQKLTDKVSAAIYELRIDEDGQVSFPFISKFITELLPNTTVEQLQENAALAFAAVHPDDIDKLWATAMLSKQMLSVWKQQYRIIQPNGEIKWLKAVAHPELQPDGSTIWYGYLEEITQLMEEQTKLKLYESAIYHSTEGVVISEVGQDSQESQMVIFANPAFFSMTGYSNDELINNIPEKLRGADTDLAQVEILETAIINGKPCQIEIINYKKSGEPFWVNIAVAPVADKKGNTTHWIAIQRDVTQLRKHLQEVETQNKKLMEIAWTQSHIVRAPLARMMGLIDMMENHRDGKKNNKELLAHLSDSAKELDKVVREIVAKTELL